MPSAFDDLKKRPDDPDLFDPARRFGDINQDQPSPDVVEPTHQQRRQNILKASDFADRGIPAYKNDHGDVTAVTDESGKALSALDSTHSIAYDSKGEPREISMGPTGPPVLKDPFADLPLRTNQKTGVQSQQGKGLYRYVGQDPVITAAATQREKDKVLKAESTAIGRKLTLDEHDLKAGKVERKALHQSLQESVPTLLDPKYKDADQETVLGAINQHFDAEYAAPEANEKAGWFGHGEYTPEAQKLRESIDQRKAKATEDATNLYSLNENLNELDQTVKEGRGAKRDRAETLLAHQFGGSGPLDELPPHPEAAKGLYPPEEDWARMGVTDPDAAISNPAVASKVAAAMPPSAQGTLEVPPQGPDGQPVAEGFWATMGREFGTKIIPAVATGAGGLAAGVAAIESGPGAIAADILAGTAAGTAAGKAQRAVMGETWAKANDAQIEANGREHPVAAQIGSMVPFLISLFGGGGAAVKNVAGKVIGKASTAAGKAAIEDAIATGVKYQAPMLERVATSAAMGARAGLSQGAQEQFVEGKDVNALDVAARSAVTFGATGLFAPAQTLLGAVLGRSVKDSAAMTLAGAIYDHAVHGKPFDLKKTAEEIGGDIPAFALQNLLLGFLHHGIASSGPGGDYGLGGWKPGTKPPEPPPGTPPDVGAELRGLAKTDPEKFKQRFAEEVAKRQKGEYSVPPPTLAERLNIIDIRLAQMGNDPAHEQERESLRREKEDIIVSSKGGGKAPSTGEPSRGPAPSTETTGTKPAKATTVEPAGETPAVEPVSPAATETPRSQKVVSPETAQKTSSTTSKAELAKAEKRFVDEGGHADKLEGQHKLAKLQKAFPDPGDRIAEIEKHFAASSEVAKSNIDTGAHEAATSPQNGLAEPTQPQKEAGNYQKGHIVVGGLDISVENPAGSRRKPEFDPLQSHYGYIKGTVGADKDHVDVFVKPGTPENYDGPVFVINQHNKAGGFDEHKAVIGATDEGNAKEIYNSNYQKGWTGGKSVIRFENPTQFKEWATSSHPEKGLALDPRLPKSVAKVASELHQTFNREEGGRWYFSDTSSARASTYSLPAGSLPGLLSVKVDSLARKGGSSTAEQAIGKQVMARLSEHKETLAGLGISHIPKLGKTKSPSGIEATPDGLLIDPKVVHEVTKHMDERTRQKTIDRAVDEEVIHMAALKWEAALPDNTVRVTEWGGEKDELSAHLAKTYEGWENLSDRQKGHEKLRAVLQKRWTGKLTEAAYRMLRDFLKYLRGIFEKLTPGQQKIVTEVEAVLKGHVAARAPPEPLKTTSPPKAPKATKLQARATALQERLSKLTEVPATEKTVISTLLRSPTTTALNKAESRIAKLEGKNAVQKPSTSSVLQPEQGQAGSAGSQRGGVEQPKQGPETPAPSPEGQQEVRQPEASSQIDEAAGKALDDAFDGLFAAAPRYAGEISTAGSQVSEGDVEQLRAENERRLGAPAKAIAVLEKTLDAKYPEWRSKAKEFLPLSGRRLVEQRDRQMERSGPAIIEPESPLASKLEPISSQRHAQYLFDQGRAIYSTLNDGESAVRIKNVQDFAKHDSSELYVLEGLFAAQPLVQQPIPRDKTAAFVKAAQALSDQNIQTPEKLAALLEARYAGKARPYSQALWDIMAAVGAVERGTHDWGTLYLARPLTSGGEGDTIGQGGPTTSQRPNVDAGAGPSGGPVAGETGGSPESGQAGGVSQPSDLEDTSGNEPLKHPQSEPELGGPAGAGPANVDTATEPGSRPGDNELKPGRTGQTDVVPESSSGRRGIDQENHVILPEDEIAPTGDITKVRANISAIKLLKTLKQEDRNATPEEKKVLARYVGWGGLPQVFDTSKSYDEEWKKKFGAHNASLRELMSPEEFAAARASTLNAHYTSREVISSMWDIARHLGFKGGNVAEFGAGVGHFFGLMPRDMAEKSRLQGIERDQTTGEILQKLYPKARIRVNGLQDVKVAPNSIDLFVGNVPFAQTGPKDPNYPPLNLHNYFLAREFDALKPGGVAIVISTTHTLDSSPKQREYLAGKAELVAAIRLPNDAFKKNAGTEVNTDILIFRKPDTQRPAPEPFVATVEVPTYNDAKPVTFNEYFGRHPDMILGRVSREGSMYGPDEPAVIPHVGRDLSEQLGEALAKLPKNIISQSTEAQPEEAEREAADAKDKPGSFIEKGGKLYIVADDKTLAKAAVVNPRFKSVELKKRAGDFIRLRETYKDLLAAQINPEATEENLAIQRGELNAHYDGYVKRHGPINELRSRPLSGDPEFGLMASLEDRSRVEEDGKVRYVFKKADVFTKRTQFPYSEPTTAESVKDGILTSLAYRGAIKAPFVAQLTGKTEEEVEKEIVADNLGYLDPATGNWHTNDHYLTGNVRAKLGIAKSAAESDSRYKRNVEALEKVQPKPIAIGEINVRLGGAWVPQEIVQDFGRQLFNAPSFGASYIAVTDTWILTGSTNYTPEAINTYAGGGMNGPELFRLALNLKTPRVTDRVSDGKGGTKQVFNPSKTAAAQGAQDKIGAEFRKYVIADEKASLALEKAYNDAFNGHVLAKYDGSHLTLPGSSESVKLRPHQKDAIWRVIQDGFAMLAHAVGAGKTYAMIGASMEMRRLGLARKPMIVVKNPTLGQFAASFLKMYPSAKVLVGTKEDLSKEKRNAFMSRIASGDWDAIVVAQSSFDRLPTDPERERAFIRSQIDELEEAIREVKKRNGKRDPSVKDMEKAKSKAEERLKELAARPKDNTINFEQLGVDALFIDEAHDYKKPPFITKLDRVGGLNTKVSKRAFSLLMKTRFIQEKNNGRNVILATGTPVTNTLGEAWQMLNLGAPHLLQDYGVTTFDRFVSAFAVVLPSMELNAAGNWVIKPRLAKFVNGPELLTMIRSGWDVLTTEELHEMFGTLDIDVPKVVGGKVEPVAVPRTEAVGKYVEFLKLVYKEYQQLSNKRDYSAVPIMAYMSGRVAALDPRLIDANAADDPGSKVNVAVGRIAEIYHETTPDKSTQLVFMENYRSMNTQKLRDFAAGEGLTLDMGEDDEAQEPMGGFNLFDDIKKKLVAAGVPEAEIAVINDYDTETQKAQLFDAMNAGTVRILMGGTQKMGVGVNVQQKLKALHHLDAPWMPSDLEQREGRAIRQGNENEEVILISYGMINTLDAGLYTKIAAKAKFLRQVLSGRFTGREFDDPTGPLIVSAEEQQALLSGNPLVLKKVEVDNQVRQLALEKEGFDAGKSSIRFRIRTDSAYRGEIEKEIAMLEPTIAPMEADIDGEKWQVKIGVHELTDRKEIIAAIDRIIEKEQPKREVDGTAPYHINNEGNLIVAFKANGADVTIKGGLYHGNAHYSTTIQKDGVIVYNGSSKTGAGILGALTDAATDIKGKVDRRKAESAKILTDVEKLTKLLDQPFDKQAELDAALAEQVRINQALLGTPGKEAAEELFETGYSEIPLLGRLDRQIEDLEAELLAADESENADHGYDYDLKEERLKTLRARQSTVEKARYDAIMKRGSEFPYGFTPNKHDGLYAARPVRAAVNLKDQAKNVAKELGLTLTESLRLLQRLVSPTTGVAMEAHDQVMKMLAERNQNGYQTDRVLEAARKMFGGMTRKEQIAFVDRVKKGEEQPTPDLQAIAEVMRKIDTDSWLAAVEAYKSLGFKDPPLAWKDNHYRVLWKVIPGETPAEQAAWIGKGRRPLRGSMGQLRAATLEDMSEGIAKGGIPYSYNPVDMFKLAQADMWKLTSTLKTWKWAKENHLVEYVRGAHPKAPDGMVPLQDSIAKVYFPAESGEGLVAGGQFFVEEGFGRLLNNYLSRDYIRALKLGRGLLWFKNATTSLELSLSAFHGVFETLEAVGSNIGLGLQRLVNRGVLKGNLGEAAAGLRDATIGAISSPVTGYALGREIRKAAANPEVYFRTAAGKKMLKAYPRAREFIDDLFAGGWKPNELEQDWKNKSIKTFVDALADLKAGTSDNYIGAGLRAFPAINEMMMKPLFDYYIPNLKVAQFFKEYAAALAEADNKYGPHGYYIDREGKRWERPTRAAMARQIWRFVEDRFGEMNFDSLFWNANFKTAMQLLFRSVTWKLGSVEAFAGAFAGQGREFLDAMRERRAPVLHRNMAWLFGMFLLTATLGAIISNVLGKKKPQSLVDYVFPQIDPKDDKVRLSAPTYFKDAVHLAHSPVNYVASSMAGWIGRVMDLLRNKDYYGVQIRDTDDPLTKQALAVGAYAGSSLLPFSVRGYKNLSAQDESGLRKLMAALGFNPAPRYIGQSPAERRSEEYWRGTRTEAGIKPEKFETSMAKRKLVTEIRKGGSPNISAAIQSGTLKPTDVKALYQRAQMGALASQVNHMPLEEAERIYGLSSAKEKLELAGVMSRKRANAARKGKKMFTGF